MKPVYAISIDTDDFSDEGLFTTSIVEKPAIKSSVVYMSEQDVASDTYKFNEEKGEIVGAILIPNMLIPRKNEQLGEYFVTFSEQTIRDIQYKASKDNTFNIFNIGHDISTDEVFLLETWIKESDNDKSSDYGFSDLPVGTLFYKAKVESEDIKTKIKDGELNGFSVEIKASLVPIKTEKMSDNTELLSAIANLTQAVEKLTNQEPAPEPAPEPTLEPVVELSEEAPEATPEETPEETPEAVTEELSRIENFAEGVESALQSVVGTKDGYYTVYVSVSEGKVAYADLSSNHYEQLMQEQVHLSEEPEAIEALAAEELLSEQVEVEESLSEEPLDVSRTVEAFSSIVDATISKYL